MDGWWEDSFEYEIVDFEGFGSNLVIVVLGDSMPVGSSSKIGFFPLLLDYV